MKKGTLIFIGIIVVIGIAAGAYYLGTQKSEEAEQTNTQADANISTNTNGQNVSTAEKREFSASGEKINNPVYNNNFNSIKIGSIPKERETIPGEPFTEDYLISSDTEGIQFQVITTESFPVEGRLTVRAYDKANKSVFSETITLDLRRGANTMCCYPVPGLGEYEAMFYYDNSLVRVLDMTVE